LFYLKKPAQTGKSPGEPPVTAKSQDAATLCLDDYPYRLSDRVRYGDLDPNQHVNNAVYATYFETGRVSLVKDPVHGLLADGLSWILVRLDIHFRAELHWPNDIELGLGMAKLGRTSVTFDQVVFCEGRCIASARSVMVMVDDVSRKPTPLPDQVIANLQRWQLRAESA
jgi:acyl-CoA thioester hydrolase